MMRAIFPAMMILVILMGCYKVELPENIPDCISDSIPEHASLQVCDTSASVAEYKFQGELVYVFSEGNCGADLGASVFNERCNEIGYLGGIAGLDTIRGESFSQNAEFVRTIWEN